MKKILSFIIIIFSLSLSFGQYSLSGTVKDAKTKEPLAGVSIYIPATKQGAVSDLDGKFQFEKITKPDIEIVFSYQGYQELHQKIHFDSPQKTIEILLPEAVFAIDQVIVSTGFNKLQKDNVMKVSHQSLANLAQKGMQNIMEGIAQVPGVSNLSTGTGIVKPVIRGLSGNRVLVYNQGVRLENYQFGEEHGMGIDAAGISGVEVIKGPASLLYGSDALGGVIYLIPEKFASKNQTVYNLNTTYFSNTSGFHISPGIKTSTDKWQFLARGSWKQNGDYQIPSGERVLNTTNKDTDLKLGVGYHQTGYKTDLRYNYNHTLNGLATGIGLENTNYDFTGKYQDLTTHNISWKNDIRWHKSHIKTNFGFSKVRRALVVNQQPFIDMRLNTFNGDIKWYAPKKQDWEWIAGTQFMWQTNSNAGQHFLLPNAHIANIAVFTNVNHSFGNSIVQGGIRYDFRNTHTETIDAGRPGFDKHTGSFSGALGYKQDLGEKMALRLNLASGFRAPNLAELTSNGEHEGRIEIGNPDLKNEQNIQADINWEYTSTHIEFFVNGFYNHINHYIYLQPVFYTANMLPVYVYQQDNAYLYGGEAGLHFHPHPWDWLHIKSSFETVTGKKQTGEYLPLIPADQWKNEIRIANKIPHKIWQKYYWFAELNRTFKARSNPYEAIYPAYTLVNTGIGAKLQYQKMTAVLNLSVHNLFNQTYISNLSVLREDHIPNQGRNLIVRFNLIF